MNRIVAILMSTVSHNIQKQALKLWKKAKHINFIESNQKYLYICREKDLFRDVIKLYINSLNLNVSYKL